MQTQRHAGRVFDFKHSLGVAIDVIGAPGSKTATILHNGELRNVVATDLILSYESLILPDDLGKPYYLAADALEPGKLTKEQPGYSVVVGYFVNATTFLVAPDLRNLGESHLHIRTVLDRTQFVPDNKPNPDPYWSGHADGIYKYDAALLNPFPPLPPEGTCLLVNGVAYLYAL